MNQRQHRRQRYIQMSTHRQPGWLFHHQLQMNMDLNLCPTLKITFKMEARHQSSGGNVGK